MDLGLAGKTAVVTGGSKGIGLETVRILSAEGVRVVAASRRPTPELAETGASHVAVDLTTARGAEELVRRAIAELGGIDLLINNVGVGDTEEFSKGALSNVAELPDSVWEHTFNLHFYSALRVTRAALPSLVDRQGTIVNVSSTGARLVNAGPADYNVSKAALNALSKILAEQFGAQGIRAVTVSPGAVSTGVWMDPDGFVGQLAKANGVTHGEFLQGAPASLGISTGRLTTPEEVARLITFLASPVNISGVDYVIDGGMLRTP